MTDTSLPERFQVLEEICRSDAEVLLRARDHLLQREVVISRPSPSLSGLQNTQEIERSLRQARALARVQHAGVVRLIDVMETKDGPVLVMEPIPGETLAERLAREKRLPPENVRALAMKLCGALEAVHAAGIVHRGVSAANVVLRDDGTPCLTGFVFAKFGHAGQGVPGTTFMYKPKSKAAPGSSGAAGSAAPAPAQCALPPHPAPEQILGQAADARCDVFGLGWMLYECLTGESPYPRELDVERWTAPADPRRLVPGTSKALAATIMKCLAPSPLKRFASAKDVREALEADAPSVSSAGQGAGGRAASGSRRKPIAVAAGVAVLLAGGGAYLAFGSGSQSGGDVLGAGPEELRGTAVRGGGSAQSGKFSDRYERSHALLIGIGPVYARNGFPALPNAERDVEAIAARLEEIRSASETWKIELLTGSKATRDNILAALSAITAEAKENDKVFVYYAGHGVPHDVSEKSGWIVPADGATLEQDSSRKTWVRFDEFGHLFDESKAKHVLVAMDCCYGGRLTAARSASAASYSRRLVSDPAKIILSSGRPNEQVSDGVRGENSPFARAFLDVLSREGAEAVTTTDIFNDIQKKFLAEEVVHLPVRGNPPGAPQSGEVVFFLR